SAERAAHMLSNGDAAGAAALAAAMAAQTSGVGVIPEQVWDVADVAASPFGADPRTASIGFLSGRPGGSASPLARGSGAYVGLVADLTAGRILEKPDFTVNRYVAHTQKTTALTVTSPVDQSAVTDSVNVVGTAAPGARIDVATVGTDVNGATVFATATAA